MKIGRVVPSSLATRRDAGDLKSVATLMVGKNNNSTRSCTRHYPVMKANAASKALSVPTSTLNTIAGFCQRIFCKE